MSLKKESFPFSGKYLQIACSLILLFFYIATMAVFAPAESFASNARPQIDNVKIKKNSTKKKALNRLPSIPQKKLANIPQKKLVATFNNAVATMEATKKNPVKACWRQPWENLRDTFLSVYQSAETQESLAVKALFKAGESQESLARCSRLAGDFSMACSIYEAVAEDFPVSSFAPDALLAAASIYLEKGRNPALGKEYLKRLGKKYPKSQAYKKAQRLIAQNPQAAQDSSKKKTLVAPRLETLSWDTISKNQVKIVLDFSAPANIETTLVKAKGKGMRIDMGIANSTVVSPIQRGVSIKGSLLKTITVHVRGKGNTHLFFDFSEVQHFSIKKERNATRIILTVDSLKNTPPKKGKDVAQDKSPKSLKPLVGNEEEKAFVVTIDAGHGGRDPGTMHNGIIERNIVLDIALRLGKILKEQGVQVLYTRKSNVFIALPRRSQKANAANANLLVSIHVNSHPLSSISGFETYYIDSNYQPDVAKLASIENGQKNVPYRKISTVALNKRVRQSRRLAVDIQNKAVRRLKNSGFGTVGHGVKSGPFCVLGMANMPAILAEVGYCTNKEEAALLSTPEYRQAIAEGIAEGIQAYQDRKFRRLKVDSSKY